MKRNKNLLRAILLEVEESPGFDGRKKQFFNFEIDGYTKAEVHFHVHMLIRAKHLEADEHEDGFVGHGLTLAGHDYLDELRDNSMLGAARNKTGKVLFCILRIFGDVVSNVVRQGLSDHFGGKSIL